jgi:leucyl-tRNA synthetase
MDPNNEKEFVSKDAVNYWKNVDLYLGGAEHATGHLLYVRFWTKFLFDMGLIPVEEPAKKLINQGMIQGRSNFVYRIKPFFIWGGDSPDDKASIPLIFATKSLFDKIQRNDLSEIEQQEINEKAVALFKKLNPQIQTEITFTPRIQAYPNHVDVNIVENDVLNIEKFKASKEENKQAEFVVEENGDYVCGSEVEKMSKSKYNVVTPDLICDNYGADTLRLYEMFLGPLEQHKPWNTNGITGVFGFLKRFWRLFFDESGNVRVSNDSATEAELKVVNRTLKKIKDDIDRYSFNTCVSQFMICVNELMELKSYKREVLEPLVIALSPFAPHISEELWETLGHKESVTKADFPAINEKYLTDDSFAYPVQINGKLRFNFTASIQLSAAEVEKEILSSEEAVKWLEGKTPKKVIVVPKRIVNIVV